MKKPKKLLKKPKLPKKVSNPLKKVGDIDMSKLSARRGKSAEQKLSEALGTVPRITNETVSEHREEVLSSARKYIYPLQHSKHRVVKISLSLFALVIVVFFAWVGLSLYKFQSTSAFMHDVTRIVPFPAAKASGDWVSYESYLFELRRNMHYYKTQQQTDFASKDGKVQLKRLKEQAMSQVVQEAYVKHLAAENRVRVTDRDVDNQVVMVRNQNRLGSNDRVFRDVLKEFWGWSEADFKRELKQQMFRQAVVAKLDTKTNQRAQDALKRLKGGEDFAKLAGEVSDDVATKASGGAYPVGLTPTNREIPPALTAAVFKLKPGEVSDIVNTGYALEIIKVTDASAGSVHASHIQFNLRDITDFVTPAQKQNPSHQYIKF